MVGANFYANIFKSGQHGRLYFQVGEHARGKTFQIYVLPEGEAAIAPYPFNPPHNPNAVEVYGIVSGQPGWTEVYGWLHQGPWVKDFELLVAQRVAEIQVEKVKAEEAMAAEIQNGISKERELLSTYK